MPTGPFLRALLQSSTRTADLPARGNAETERLIGGIVETLLAQPDGVDRLEEAIRAFHAGDAGVLAKTLCEALPSDQERAAAGLLRSELRGIRERPQNAAEWIFTLRVLREALGGLPDAEAASAEVTQTLVHTADVVRPTLKEVLADEKPVGDLSPRLYEQKLSDALEKHAKFYAAGAGGELVFLHALNRRFTEGQTGNVTRYTKKTPPSINGRSLVDELRALAGEAREKSPALIRHLDTLEREMKAAGLEKEIAYDLIADLALACRLTGVE